MSATPDNIAESPTGVSPVTDPWRDIPRYLLSRWRFVGSVMVCAVVVYAILLLLVPDQFRAQAKIIILPPRFMSEVRIEPLSVETARNLIQSPEIMFQIIEQVRNTRTLLDKHIPADKTDRAIESFSVLSPAELEKNYGVSDTFTTRYLAGLKPSEIRAILDWNLDELADWTVEDLQNALESEEVVEKKTATDIKFSPLIILTAKADDGAKAQLIVNTWAALFEKKYSDLASAKTTNQTEFIEKQQDESQKDLVKIQDEIVRYKTEHNLELYQREIDQYSSLYNEFLASYVQKQNTLLTQRQQLAENFRVLEAIEQGRSWVGLVNPARPDQLTTPPLTADVSFTTASDVVADDQNPPDSISRPLQLSPDDYTASEQGGAVSLARGYRQMRERSLMSKGQLLEALDDARKFYSTNPIELLETDRDQIRKDYLEQASKLRLGETRLKVLQETLAKLDEELSATRHFVVLEKDVPDEAIAEAAASRQPQNMAALSRFKFERQEFNPVWISLQEQRTRLANECEMALNEVTELRSVLPVRKQDLDELQHQIYSARMQEGLVKLNLEKMQNSNRDLLAAYLATSQDIYSTVRQIGTLEAEIRQLERSTSETKRVIEDLQQEYNSSSAELQRMQSRERAILRKADLLLQKYQEAQIAKAQDVSDVSVAASAVMPTQHFFPPRTILLVVLTFFTAVILLAVMARSRYMDTRGMLS